eukprot:scaffold60735_cov65-Phaeocystis_antarctica.AAC.2
MGVNSLRGRVRPAAHTLLAVTWLSIYVLLCHYTSLPACRYHSSLACGEVALHARPALGAASASAGASCVAGAASAPAASCPSADAPGKSTLHIL